MGERKKEYIPLNITSPSLSFFNNSAVPLLLLLLLGCRVNRVIQPDDDRLLEEGSVRRVYLAHDGLVGRHDGVGEGLVLADLDLDGGGGGGDEGGAEGQEESCEGEGTHFCFVFGRKSGCCVTHRRVGGGQKICMSLLWDVDWMNGWMD